MSDTKIRAGRTPLPIDILDPAQPSTSRRARLEAQPMIAIPRNELTPSVETTVSKLLEELALVRTQLDEAERRVAELECVADEDPLVPVLNRRGFVRELERAMAFSKRHGSELCLIYIDMDDFKEINDTFGHNAGDAVLKEVGALLLGSVRRSDIVGRLGGDEFAIVLQNAPLAMAEKKAAQIEESASQSSIIIGGQEFVIGLSAGTAAIVEGDTTEVALARADQAMFSRKSEKKKVRQ